MPITHLPLAELLGECPAESSRRRTLADVNVRIAKARKVVVVSGAGISCSSGIPDFRSENGLYALVKNRYPDSFVTGKDLFSSGLFTNPQTTSIFFTFIAELFLACEAAHPTRTHDFIHRLEKKGKLLRSYTQNVDGFERRMGLESGGRGRGYKKNGTRNVELHGDLGRVRCVLCSSDYPACDEWVNMFREGVAPSCPACEERHIERISRCARPTAIGSLRPSIVLYDEPHPLGDEISELQAHDMRRGPDVLLVMGTSLKVHGLKRLVKDFAKAVHGKKEGIVVFVNATAPSKEWDSVIDYHIEGETDRWVERMEDEWKRVRPQDWEIQGTLDASVVRGSIAKATAKAKKSKAAKKPQLSRLDLPLQLPTPPPSQSPTASPSASACSSPLSSCPPSSPPSSSPPGLPLSPSSPPVSPSKRSGSRSLSVKANKKSRFAMPPPRTGVPATPGRGNLFAPSQAHNMPDSSTPPDPESDSEVFDSPAAKARTARSRAKSATIAASLRPSLSASATVTAPVTSRPRTRGALLAEVVIPVNAKKRVLAASKGDKENAAPPPVTRLGAARGMRRTVSVPA